MAFKALRAFKYEGAGGAMQMAKPGDNLPADAATWRNIDRMIRMRWVTMANGEIWEGRQFRIPASAKVAAQAASAKKAPPKPKPKVEKKMSVAAPALVPDPIQDKYTEDSLSKLLKSDVQAIASEMGLDTDGTKADLIGIILEAQGG